MRQFLIPVCGFGLCLLTGSCRIEENAVVTTGGIYESVGIADSLGIGAGEAEVFLLPAPLQVATVLRNNDVPYRPTVLAGIRDNITYTSDFSRSLVLGIYAIDLGYAALYEDYPICIRYAKAIEALLGELNINVAGRNSLAERFERNVSNRDSLCAILLEAYGEAYDYLQQNEQEGLGLLVLVGCYVEGLYLSSSVIGNLSDPRLSGLIPQQNLYLENIRRLLEFYSAHDDSESLSGKLKSLKNTFEEAGFGSGGTPGLKDGKKVPPMEREVILNRLRAQISAIRQKLIS